MMLPLPPPVGRISSMGSCFSSFRRMSDSVARVTPFCSAVPTAGAPFSAKSAATPCLVSMGERGGMPPFDVPFKLPKASSKHDFLAWG